MMVCLSALTIQLMKIRVSRLLNVYRYGVLVSQAARNTCRLQHVKSVLEYCAFMHKSCGMDKYLMDISVTDSF
jgi:hypothetical protein